MLTNLMEIRVKLSIVYLRFRYGLPLFCVIINIQLLVSRNLHSVKKLNVIYTYIFV